MRVSAVPELINALDPEALERIASDLSEIRTASGQVFSFGSGAQTLRSIAKLQRAALVKAKG